MFDVQRLLCNFKKKKKFENSFLFRETEKQKKKKKD